MRGAVLSVAFMPLVDAAPFVVAQEMGFAAEEGITLDLVRAPSWSSVRDMLAFGRVEAAHMLSPVPVATALGLGGGGTQFEALSVTSVNGNVIGVTAALAKKMRAAGYGFDFADARAAGEALIAASEEKLRIGVPFPFSMHAELLYYWLSSLGLPAPQGVTIRTVPPPLMADAIDAGEIDAFCVGEPWGSIAVENGVGSLLLPGRAIWSFAPEKVLAVRRDWAASEPDLSARLIRALWRAGRWLADPASRVLAAELMSHKDYLDLSPEIIDRALSGHFVIAPSGDHRTVEGFSEYHAGAAGFPWRSQAQWIACQLAARTGLDRADAAHKAADVFRPDLYRAALEGIGAPLPGASSKIEGHFEHEEAVASHDGRLILAANAFFDGRFFDPNTPER
ncbi:MAG: CmpA/NrtA family ABC transporter substrate-binding protein [Maritimibacter sp.]